MACARHACTGSTTFFAGEAIVVTLSRQLSWSHVVALLPAHLTDWGTGDLELSLTSQADMDTAKPLILMSYQGRTFGFRKSILAQAALPCRAIRAARLPSLACHHLEITFPRDPHDDVITQVRSKQAAFRIERQII